MERYRISCAAPLKKWYQTDNGLWTSREWEPREKQAYERDVLYR